MENNRVSIFLSILFLFVFFQAHSEKQVKDTARFEKYGFVIETNYHLGRILKGYKDFPERNFTSLAEVKLARQTYGKKEWQQYLGNPLVGVSFFYGYLGNSSVFGNLYAIVPNITFRLAEKKQWAIKVNMGMGFSYFDMPFDKERNPENKLVGSDITNMSFASLLFERRVSPVLSVSGGVSTFHCSNGHYQLPNVGINLPAYTLSLKYNVQPLPPHNINHPIEKERHKIRKNIIIGIGVHEFGGSTGPVGGPKYPVYQAGIYLSKRYGPISNVQIGISGRYYTSFYEYIKEQNRFQDNQKLNSCVFTLFLAHELLARKFSFFTQGGINLFNPLKDEVFEINGQYIPEKPFIKKLFSAKIGAQYYLLNTYEATHGNVFFGLYLNTNFGQADFIETAIGLSL